MRSLAGRGVRVVARETVGLLRRLRSVRTSSARVLYYHRIDDEQHRSCVSPAAFAEQMAHLRREGYAVLPLLELRSYLDEHRPFPERAVVVTFDDGFADNFTRAFPVLVRHAVPATIFLTAGFIGGSDLPVLRDRAGIAPLSWQQVEEMSRHGIDFGAHTITHRSLPALDASDLQREVAGSRALIEERCGLQVESFCYPRGELDARVKQAVREAGYRLACTTAPGCVTPRTHPFSLRRTFIARDDGLRDFAHKLAGTFDVLHGARQRWSAARR